MSFAPRNHGELLVATHRISVPLQYRVHWFLPKSLVKFDWRLAFVLFIMGQSTEVPAWPDAAAIWWEVWSSGLLAKQNMEAIEAKHIPSWASDTPISFAARQSGAGRLVPPTFLGCRAPRPTKSSACHGRVQRVWLRTPLAIDSHEICCDWTCTCRPGARWRWRAPTDDDVGWGRAVRDLCQSVLKDV